MDELRVGADADHFRACFLELCVQLCQSSKLSSSDKGKIGRIKKEYSPFLLVSERLEAYFSKIAFRRLIRLKLKIGNAFPDP
jgi:hypothetical protein